MYISVFAFITVALVHSVYDVQYADVERQNNVVIADALSV